MGYTTDFWGQVTVSPALNPAEVEYLRALASTRRMHRGNGPYFVKGTGFAGQGQDGDVLNYNAPDPSQPGLWCQWVPTDDGTAIEWDGGEKFYESAEWMRYIVRLISEKPDALELVRMVKADERFEQFTFDHVVNGTIDAQGEEPDDRWRLVVTDNKVETQRASVSFG
jgi:hypothetical protein